MPESPLFDPQDNYYGRINSKKLFVLIACERIIITRRTKGLFTWREGAPANRATWGGLTSHTFLSKTHRSVYMLGRVARLPGAPCLLARGTRQGGVAFST